MDKHRLYFEEQHTAIEELLMEHLLAVVGADFAHAQQLYQQWQVALLAHIRIENEQLLPHIPEGARWAEKIYRLEHDRIALLAEEYADHL
ncbi:MAG: hypothetical protein KIG95_07955, partial [Comamonas sp.]|nr:hypothetical protein [Comamonas sp.]